MFGVGLKINSAFFVTSSTTVRSSPLAISAQTHDKGKNKTPKTVVSTVATNPQQSPLPATKRALLISKQVGLNGKEEEEHAEEKEEEESGRRKNISSCENFSCRARIDGKKSGSSSQRVTKECCEGKLSTTGSVVEKTDFQEEQEGVGGYVTVLEINSGSCSFRKINNHIGGSKKFNNNFNNKSNNSTSPGEPDYLKYGVNNINNKNNIGSPNSPRLCTSRNLVSNGDGRAPSPLKGSVKKRSASIDSTLGSGSIDRKVRPGRINKFSRSASSDHCSSSPNSAVITTGLVKGTSVVRERNVSRSSSLNDRLGRKDPEESSAGRSARLARRNSSSASRSGGNFGNRPKTVGSTTKTYGGTAITVQVKVRRWTFNPLNISLGYPAKNSAIFFFRFRSYYFFSFSKIALDNF